MSFAPKLSALPAPQRALWPELKQVPRKFILYGGTALVIRFAHRNSMDFDFFTEPPVNPEELARSLPLLQGGTVRQSGLNTLTIETGLPHRVKLSFFGVGLGRVREPELTDDGVLWVASPLDIAACKMATIQSRAETRDYHDIQMLMKSGITIADALGAAQAIYGEQFNPIMSLKALGSFVDGDLKSLPRSLQQELRAASMAVREIPKYKRLPGGVNPNDE